MRYNNHIYTVGRSYLLEQFHSLLDSGQIRFPDNETLRGAFAQPHALEPEYRETGVRTDSTTILPSPALCWPGRHTTRIWTIGCALSK
jgi:hypothetical protein